MTKEQLDTALASVGLGANTPGQAFYVPEICLLFFRGVVRKTVAVVQGQPNIAVPLSFASPQELSDLLTLLNTPTNGHKLFLPATPVRLLCRMLPRVARQLNGNLFQSEGSNSGSIAA